jgi:type IV secretion system protein VirD4
MANELSGIMNAPIVRGLANMVIRLLRKLLFAILAIWAFILGIVTLFAVFGEDSMLNAMFQWAIFGAFAFGANWLLTNGPQLLMAKAQRAEADEHWTSLGKDPQTRSRAIDALFDQQKAVLAVGERLDFTEMEEKQGFDGKPTTGMVSCHIQFEVRRSLADMEPRERELLRAAYHLYNEGLIDEQAWRYFRIAFIFGDGKGVVYEYDVFLTKELRSSIRGGTDAVRLYCSRTEATVGEAVNMMLDMLDQTPQEQLPKSVRKVHKRIHGGETWLEEDEIDDTPFTLEPVPGALLGDFPESGSMVRYAGEGSMITVAPPGSGKTQCHVFPTLLSWPGPAVVLDVKGEIYEGTSKWRSENVGPVYKFSPLNPDNSHSYNPLTTVRSHPDYLWEDSRFLADMMMVPSGGKDPFWENRARDVLTAAIARVCLEEDVEKRPFGDVIDVFHGVGWDEFVQELQLRVDFRSMTRAGHSLGGMEPKTRDGVLQTGLSSLSAWDGDRIERATRRSDWTPQDLRKGDNPTVYICLTPNEVESYISVLRVFIAQHIRQLTTELPPRGQSPILFLLDELPRLRQMPPVEEALEIGRQYGIKLWMFTQSIGQLQTAYENADGMIGSCAVRMYMNPSLHDETAKKISEDIGMQEGVMDRNRQAVVEPSVLAGPEYRDNVIVMASGCKPLRLKKHFAWSDPTISQRMGRI